MSPARQVRRVASRGGKSLTSACPLCRRRSARRKGCRSSPSASSVRCTPAPRWSFNTAAKGSGFSNRQSKHHTASLSFLKYPRQSLFISFFFKNFVFSTGGICCKLPLLGKVHAFQIVGSNAWKGLGARQICLKTPLTKKGAASSVEYSRVPVLLGDDVQAAEHDGQDLVDVLLYEAENVLVVPEVQRPLCYLPETHAHAHTRSQVFAHPQYSSLTLK